MYAGYTVLGYIDENLALNKPATQVSVYNNLPASRAVDGQLNTIACTNDAAHPWLSVDLGAAYDVAHVTVINHDYAGNGNHRRSYTLCIIYHIKFLLCGSMMTFI